MQAERFRVEKGANDYDLVQLHRLTKTYQLIHKKIIAVNNISIGIPAGEVRNNVLFLSLLYMEEEMATHSSILAWKIPWTEEPGRLHPWGSQKSWILLSMQACMHPLCWHGKWQKFYLSLIFSRNMKSAFKYFDGFYIYNLHVSMCYLSCNPPLLAGRTHHILIPFPSYYPSWVDFQSRSLSRELFSTLSF